MSEHQGSRDRKWWQDPATITAVAALITAIGTLVGSLYGAGPA